jgi:hypothetical protein
VIQGHAGAAGAPRAILAGLDLLMQWQDCQGRLDTVWSDLPDLPARGKAHIEVAMAVYLDALRALSGCKVKEGNGLNLDGRGARRDEGVGHGEGQRKNDQSASHDALLSVEVGRV